MKLFFLNAGARHTLVHEISDLRQLRNAFGTFHEQCDSCLYTGEE